MTLEEFSDDETETERVVKPLTTRMWRAQIERVFDTYIAECERYRREVKTLQDQVNEMAKSMSDMRK